MSGKKMKAAREQVERIELRPGGTVTATPLQAD